MFKLTIILDFYFHLCWWPSYRAFGKLQHKYHSMSTFSMKTCCVILVSPQSPHSCTCFSAQLWYISHLSVEEILNLWVCELSCYHFETAHNDSYHHLNYLLIISLVFTNMVFHDMILGYMLWLLIKLFPLYFNAYIFSAGFHSYILLIFILVGFFSLFCSIYSIIFFFCFCLVSQ